MARCSSVVAFALLSWVTTTAALASDADSPFPEPGQLDGRAAGEVVTKRGVWNGAETDFGYLLVPENRMDPHSRLLELPFVRQHALEGPTSEPIFVLSGGPGQSNLWVDLPQVFFAQNDLVRVGYRGVDGAVRLVCPGVGQALSGARPLSPEGIARTREALRGCYEELVAQGVDLDGYDMVEVADDVEAVRLALGFDSISLFSTSYGTQVAYIYCQRHPTTAYRSLMIGVGNRARRFEWDARTIDHQLTGYADLWRADPEAAARTPDLLGTISRVLESLPVEWHGVPLDKDKLRLATFYLLYETATAAAVFDAYVEADKGDPAGLAVVCLGYDDDVQSTSRRYWGDFFSKIMSGGFQTACNPPGEADSHGGVLGSPANEMWVSACDGGWPTEPIPEEYCHLSSVSTLTLVLNGSLDFSSPPEHAMELAPYLLNGTIVLLPGMGHMDVVKLQRSAFETAVSAFFQRGVVDTSGYRPQALDFTPDETYGGYARELFRDEAAGEGE